MAPKVRKGQGDPRLPAPEFDRRFRTRFFDPAFADREPSIDQLGLIAHEAYEQGRKSPVTRKAGTGFADPDHDISVDWLAAREAVWAAQTRHDDAAARARVLLICASPRNDKSCPGEMSKSFRLCETAQEQLRSEGAEVDLLDLSQLTSEYGKVIYPCKACVSTAMPLCHWPCSCYPNHSLGQVNDWMNEIYARWVAAHGVMIVTPVHWYQAPSVLKLMMDRMVCADGGNPDPTSTHGKKADEAKALELAGWPYPRHLAGRSFSVLVHGDAAGTEAVRHALTGWLTDMRLVQAGSMSCIDRLIGYYGPYASSHEELDRDDALFAEVRNAARSLLISVSQQRRGMRPPDAGLSEPRPK